MNNICIAILITLIISLCFSNDLHQKNKRLNIDNYPINTSYVFTKETLNELVDAKQDKIIAKTINDIVYSVIYEASRGIKKYTWENNIPILDNYMYDKIKIKLEERFSDVKISYLDNYNILIDWDKYDIVNYEE